MKILIVVDMQNDFVNGELGTPEAQAIVPKIAEKCKEARKNYDTIIFTKDLIMRRIMRRILRESMFRLIVWQMATVTGSLKSLPLI